MVSVDYEDVINRIIVILKNDSRLFPAVSIGDGKLREIYFGEDSAKIHDQSYPYVLVTTPDRPFQTKDIFGIGDGSSDPQHTVQYLIRVFAKEGRPQVAEKFLYGFIKKIVDILKANPRLKEPQVQRRCKTKMTTSCSNRNLHKRGGRTKTAKD